MKRVIENLPDMLIVTGALCTAYGAGMVYAPAGFIVLGLELLVAGVSAARARQPQPEAEVAD